MGLWQVGPLQNTCTCPANTLQMKSAPLKYPWNTPHAPLRYFNHPSENPRIVPEGMLLEVPPAEDPPYIWLVGREL